MRFANAPIVTVVNDRRDVPKQPANRIYLPSLYNYAGTVEKPLDRALSLRRRERAVGVNALDEVPDSTWFTNRIGMRDLTPDEIRNGPLTADSPELHRPWTVKSTKAGGATLGFVITDARGLKYVLKFDDAGIPEIQTGIDVIVNRLLWAAGYNVPEDEIVYFRDEDLVVAPDAVIKDPSGDKVGKLDRAGLESRLAQIDHGPDGRIRALVSRWISGKTIGGHTSEGVRSDDPNDLIPHELRRDLRGAYSIFAWVDHVDIHEGNFVDSWEPDPADKNRHYVRHYFIDFGRSMGGMALFSTDWRRGHTYVVDFADIAHSFFTFGLREPAWKYRPVAPASHVASFDATTFDPGSWHPDWPAYLPFVYSDRIDKFWGAKILSRFTRAQIEAAVSAGKISEPEGVRYIVDTLIARQRQTLAYWFARVAPIDHVAVAEPAGRTELCFDDLGLTTRVADIEKTSYTVRTYDWHGHEVSAAAPVVASATGRTCTPIAMAPTENAGGYTIVRLSTVRPGASGETQIHLGREPTTNVPRVIGIWRP